MSADTSKLRKKIAKLNKSLDELESQLEPLFAQSLDETLLELDTIQQAKMQVIIPYVVYDLVFVYLKTRGVDPMTHPVIAELDRVRQYFDKIQKAEESDQKRKVGIDKGAAGRFIKHAIAQAKNVHLVDETGQDADVSTAGPSNTNTVPVKVTAKMLERAEYEKNLKETADEEEEDLEVFGENVEEDYPMDDTDELPAEIPSDVRSADKGKEEEEPGRIDEEQAGSRRKRPRVDPFAGYDDISPLQPAVARAKSKPALAETHSGRSTPASSAPDEPQSSKSSKKKSKRKAKN